MGSFWHTAFSFPTVVFSTLLMLVILYWCVAAIGILDIDVLDFDSDLDVGEGLHPEGMAGLFLKVGLGGVPVTIVLTLLILFGWLIIYFIQLFLLNHLSWGILRYPIGALALVGAFVASVPISATLCRPLRPIFRKLEAPTRRSVLGQTALVRSEQVTSSHGEATLEDGGAGLILKVRADESLGFKRGDRVVLLEYLENQHAYRVISEDEFRGV